MTSPVKKRKRNKRISTVKFPPTTTLSLTLDISRLRGTGIFFFRYSRNIPTLFISNIVSHDNRTFRSPLSRAPDGTGEVPTAVVRRQNLKYLWEIGTRGVAQIWKKPDLILDGPKSFSSKAAAEEREPGKMASNDVVFLFLFPSLFVEGLNWRRKPNIREDNRPVRGKILLLDFFCIYIR